MEIGDIGKCIEGVWFPKEEHHMVEWMLRGKKSFMKEGKPTYQWQKQEAAMQIADKYIPNWRDGVFVDVGGHCGFWSMWWGIEMSRVVAFEPIEYLRTIYQANMGPTTNYMVLPYALSNEHGGTVEMKVFPENTGATRLWAEGEERPDTVQTHEAKVTTLDYALPAYLNSGEPMKVLKIDCEGFEEKVVRGGADVIRKYKPLVIVEQKFEGRHFDFEEKGAVHVLEGWGYKAMKVLAGDHIMVHKDFL